VIAELRQARPEVVTLVVDDGSDDATSDLLPALGIPWLRLDQHLGLGGAMRAGLRWASLLGHDTVVRLDGDGQHQPEEIDRLLAALRAGAADAVQGTRYAGAGGYHSTRARRLGQRALAGVLSRLTGRPVTDPTSGFWAFGPRAVRLLGEHHPSGYPEPELLLFLHRNGLRVAEVSIEMRRRLAGRTSLTAPRVGLALARLLLITLVAPLRPPVEVRTR
jgi:glycosyltransferase involved in cell wall biosynthesis